MPNNQIKTSTFCQRKFGCYFFKENINYVKRSELLNKKIIVQYQQYSETGELFSFSNAIVKLINNWSRHDQSIIDDGVDEWNVNCATNLSQFFKNHKVENLLDKYVWRARLYGDIVGQANINNKVYNIDFSYHNSYNTFYEGYYYAFNFYLYNQVKDLNHDGLVYIIPENKFYHIKYDPNAYTISRGLLSINIKSKMLRPGHHCLRCSVKGCKPRLINDERML